MPEGLFKKLVESLQDPLQICLLLGVIIFYRLFIAEREAREKVQGKRDEISTLYHEQGKSLMVLLEHIKARLK